MDGGKIMTTEMSSMERVMTALDFKEPDRVPLFLLFSMYGAKELGLGIKKYFSDPDNVVKAQIYMKEKYRNDCYYASTYVAVEVEACGGEVIFSENGPPNAGRPIIKHSQDILSFDPPKVKQTKCLLNTLEIIQKLKNHSDSVPIIGTVVSPFSLPVMQMGFDKYLDLMYDDRQLFADLMSKNEAFCVEWANAQLAAGATAIVYFDPVSSPSIIPREMYLKTGFEVARRTIPRINGATATHFASGNSLPIIDDIVKTGTAAIGVSSMEDIGEIKQKCHGKLSIIGNLNGIEMCHWSIEDTQAAVKNIITKGAKGGGLVISDNHGEIPFQVKEETLHAIADAVKKWGHY